MSNSPLVSYTKISPFKNSPRNKPISKITWHHMAGVMSVEGFGSMTTKPGADMSATYSIGSDARVGLHVDEADRPWTSSSPSNDNMAVTIEISNSAVGEPWPVSDKVFNKAIELTVDICKRNGIKELIYTGDSSGNFTFHRFYRRTSCPGTYLFNRANEICTLVNKQLIPTTVPQPTPTSEVNVGSLVSIDSNAVYYNGTGIPSWVKSQKWYVSQITGNRAVLGKSEDGKQNIQSPINTQFIKTTDISNTQPIDPSFKSYTIRLGATSSIFTDGTGSTTNNVIGGKGGVFTIVGEQTTNGVKYGKLKSGAGWVKVSQEPVKVDNTIRVGDTVRVLNAIQYNGKSFKVYVDKYKVLELKGDRAVISADGKNVTVAINTNNLKKV